MNEIPGDVAIYLEARERALGEVRRLLAHVIDHEGEPEDLDPEAALFGTGLGLDSLDAVEILVALEADLGVVLEGNDPVKLGLRSVNTVVDAVMRARGELR